MRKGYSQEGLKLIACVSMLLDHIGYLIVYPMYLDACMVNGVDMLGAAAPAAAKKLYAVYMLLRIMGRLAFPIFCFLLVEGFHRTGSRKGYALRLAAAALLSEVPFDLMISGKIFWIQQSVMVTLLLGFGALVLMEKCRSLYWKPLAVIPFALGAELLLADYGWVGVAVIALFELTRYLPTRMASRFFGMLILFHYTPGHILEFGGFSVPMQVLGVFSLFFIAWYDGRKLTKSRAVQWAFYLFYPVHILLLWLISLAT